MIKLNTQYTILESSDTKLFKPGNYFQLFDQTKERKYISIEVPHFLLLVQPIIKSTNTHHECMYFNTFEEICEAVNKFFPAFRIDKEFGRDRIYKLEAEIKTIQDNYELGNLYESHQKEIFPYLITEKNLEENKQKFKNEDIKVGDMVFLEVTGNFLYKKGIKVVYRVNSFERICQRLNFMS